MGLDLSSLGLPHIGKGRLSLPLGVKSQLQILFFSAGFLSRRVRHSRRMSHSVNFQTCLLAVRFDRLLSDVFDLGLAFRSRSGLGRRTFRGLRSLFAGLLRGGLGLLGFLRSARFRSLRSAIGRGVRLHLPVQLEQLGDELFRIGACHLVHLELLGLLARALAHFLNRRALPQVAQHVLGNVEFDDFVDLNLAPENLGATLGLVGEVVGVGIAGSTGQAADELRALRFGFVLFCFASHMFGSFYLLLFVCFTTIQHLADVDKICSIFVLCNFILNFFSLLFSLVFLIYIVRKHFLMHQSICLLITSKKNLNKKFTKSRIKACIPEKYRYNMFSFKEF